MNVCEQRRTIELRAEVYEVPCGSRYCAACGKRWQGDMRVQAVAASEHLAGGVALITITAPGSDYFHSDDRWASMPVKDRYRRWNRHARRRWRVFHLRATRPLRAWADKHNVGWRLLFRSWEYQKRGALHLHLVVPYDTPDRRRFTDLYVHNLWAEHDLFHFGWIHGGDRNEKLQGYRPPSIVPADGPAAARYVCKYVASTGAGKGSMVEVAQRTAQRGSVLYISPSLTSASGINMTKLRSRRRIVGRMPWALKSHEEWKAACLVDSIQRGRPPLTEEAVQTIRRAVRATGAALWVDTKTGEVHTPTEAPPPRDMARTCHLRERDGERLDPELVAVLLPDPTRPWLGPIRTVIED